MTNKNYLTFGDAIKIQGPKAFTAVTKPVGPLCNLNCTYCYYLDKERLYGKKREIMPYHVLERYIRQYINTNQIPVVTFIWHGGEPLLAGLDFYKKVVDLQAMNNPGRKKIVNAIQTNGTLLNDEWCRFFKRNNFLVGISVDGPQDIHDAYRLNKEGLSTFGKTMRGLDLLKMHNVEFNTLTVVNNLSEGKGREIYNFLKSTGSHYMQFLPASDYIANADPEERPIIVSPLTSTDAVPAPWSVSAKGYGQFLIDIFNEWVINDVGSYFVQLFDLTLESWFGYEPSVCAYCQSCGDNFAMEHNGDFYSCDHFVYQEHYIGNIMENSLMEMVSSPSQVRFGINKRNTLSEECLQCEYYFACGGECPKHRHTQAKDGEKKFALCEGIKMYYRHTEPYMKYMVELLRREQAPSGVMPWARVLLNKQ